MKKTILALAALAAIAAGCGGGKGQGSMIPVGQDTTVTTKTQTDDNQGKANPEAIETRVKEIYEKVAEAYPDLPDLTPMNDSLELAFCTSRWQMLTEVITERDAMGTGDVGFFSSDYWVMGQDYSHISASDIKATLKDNSHAEVTLNLHNGGKVVKVRLEMVFERGEWYIDNFINESQDYNWMEAMEKYIEENVGKTDDADNGIVEYEVP